MYKNKKIFNLSTTWSALNILSKFLKAFEFNDKLIITS